MGSRVERELGRRINAYRGTAKLTQEELAERVGVTPETISRLERGTASTSVRTLVAIASALGVELRDLADFETIRPVQNQSLRALVRELEGRTPEEIRAVREILRRVLDMVDGRGRQRKRGARS
jgi:transcriptional regulator with XRE-family HTH domain